jgi:hypothetical protein
MDGKTEVFVRSREWRLPIEALSERLLTEKELSPVEARRTIRGAMEEGR